MNDTPRYTVRLKTVSFQVAEAPAGEPVSDSAKAVRVLRAAFEDLDADQEHVVLLALNAKNRVVGVKHLFSGGMTASVLDPKIVWRAALALGAYRVIVGHNHPSGDPSPSPDDDASTRRLVEGGKVLAIDLVDHVVLGSGDSYFSYQATGRLDTLKG